MGPAARRLVIVSNRGPYRREGGQVRGRLVRAAGGLVSALDPVLGRRGGVWVSGDSIEAADDKDGARPETRYKLCGVELPKPVQTGYYDGFSNAVLWPLLHGFSTTIRLSEAPWNHYARANHAFAEQVLTHSRPEDLIWVQDYHLMLLPRIIRAARPKTRTGWFCHVPWPHPETFRVLPWRTALLEGLLGADVLGFHTQRFTRNFLACVHELTDHSVDFTRGTIDVHGRVVQAATAPIGIDTEAVTALARQAEVCAETERIRSLVGGRRIILGVDRLDYTKGIVERLLAYESFLKQERDAAARCVYVQVMVPSRTDVRAYKELKREIDRLVGDINGRFASTGRIPVHYFFRNLNLHSLYAHYRAADIALVTPLRDGMNLVAHEYVTARTRDDGALILSEFAGAATYLDTAYRINPYDIWAIRGALVEALRQKPAEEARRMAALRSAVKRLDVHRWAAAYLDLLDAGAA
ncbi:MAG: alpha,alpha-trehalose-phosphate synthase (UDP-forming) [Polyangiales bacterium]